MTCAHIAGRFRSSTGPTTAGFMLDVKCTFMFVSGFLCVWSMDVEKC